jgi:hypothetical protein
MRGLGRFGAKLEVEAVGAKAVKKPKELGRLWRREQVCLRGRWWRRSKCWRLKLEAVLGGRDISRGLRVVHVVLHLGRR